MGFLQAVQADPQVVEVGLADAREQGLVDQGPVGGQGDIEAQGLGLVGQVEDVRAHQGLAAGEDQHRDAEGAQVLHDPIDLVCR